jgi:hypothetical protein
MIFLIFHMTTSRVYVCVRTCELFGSTHLAKDYVQGYKYYEAHFIGLEVR